MFLFIEVIQRKGGLFLTFALPEVFLVGRVVVTAFNHAADKFYGGIIFLRVVLTFGFDYHFTKRVFGRRKCYFIGCITGRANGADLVIISDYRDYKHCFGAVGFEVKASVASGSSSFGRVF